MGIIMGAEYVLSTSDYTPKETPIPPLPDASFFSDAQWETLFSLTDTIIPSIRTSAKWSNNDKIISPSKWDSAISRLTSLMPGPNAAETAKQYLQENVSFNPVFRAHVQRILGDNVHEEGRKGLGFILNALNSRAGSFLATGSITPIHLQSLEFREKVFQGWDTSRWSALRAVYRALTGIAKKSWVMSSPTINQVLGFPHIPIHGKPADSFPYKFLQIPPGNDVDIILADIVIVGSGCGAGITAKNLAEAGLRVIVVEKSYSYTSAHFPMRANEAGINMFENGGAINSDDGSMMVIAGSTFGGGGTVNWSASLQTQAYVRQEWADTGLPFFTSSEFQRSLDRVCNRMGVNTGKIKHSRGNNVIRQGAHKLGYAARAVPQNTGNAGHYCGHCTYGCASCGKKGPAESFLADAAKAGTVFIEGYQADKILFDKSMVPIGVEGTWKSRDSYLGNTGSGCTQRKVIIKAPRVVVSCGALQSPLLLLRSGLKNDQIGKNLHLHPCMVSSAVFEETIRPWEGAALTAIVNEFENLDGHGHGVKIEALSMMPSFFLPLFPWRDGLDYKLWAAAMSHSTSFITLTRDRDGGRVYPDPTDGRCRIEYTVSPFDRRHIVTAMIACAKIAYITGAKEFHTGYRDIPPYIRPDNFDPLKGINEPSLQDWISDLRRKSPLNPERAVFASAHQMGTCRMGTSPKTSVVDPSCQVWGTEGLYVLDTSVFPSSSGVNPMVTTMAIADWASRNIAHSLGKSCSEGKGFSRL
ncbi:hypothetical protein N7495_003206 [Penicillium taxi]|uniref:uncharacterized protein n=1 Tax=Penicillium taxi TaxID=168475 RepID=UPI0025450282|nr:uncharacterized protein N7495_003206 [Penicillium taxi]KAJ5902678.1 hypothetical protein N7495_003206 [Penicillium taxi]